MASDSCIFCKIVRGEAPAAKVFEDEHTLALMDIFPVTDGHTLVITKDHAENLFEASSEALQAVAATAKRVAHALKDTLAPDGLMVFQLNGAAAETVEGPLGAKAGDKAVAWAEKAGMRASVPTTYEVGDLGPDKSHFAIKYVSSQQTGEGEATHLIDGDSDTYWHTAYALTVTKHPHTVDIDLGEAKTFKAVAYLPRQDGPNGRVADYRFAISDDGTNWTSVAEGRFPRGEARQVVNLKAPVTARYLRFVALSEVSGQDFASAAEIDIVP